MVLSKIVRTCAHCGGPRTNRGTRRRFCSHACYHEKRRNSVTERFLSKVRRDGPITALDMPCWLWLHALDKKGYGKFSLRGRPTQAHRAAWELFRGTIPRGLCVLHRCDVPRCCNPSHLFLGTIADNNRDMAAKNRASGGSAAGSRHGSKTHPERMPRGETHGCAILTEELVRMIRRERAAGTNGADVARRIGVSTSIVSSVFRRRTWAHVD